jgi:hypothetical protein
VPPQTNKHTTKPNNQGAWPRFLAARSMHHPVTAKAIPAATPAAWSGSSAGPLVAYNVNSHAI